ncbi:hypothetical protein Hdeb2414_s0016g00497311 [Helianthus debilis subsp. tardiflorus]
MRSSICQSLTFVPPHFHSTKPNTGQMYLRRFLLLVQLICLTPSVSAVCEYSITDNNKVYSYNLAASSKQFPHGVLSEDGYYKVSSNGTVVWFQLCESMIFNHDPPKCFDCWECGGSTRCGMGCSALMSNNINGYPICTTIGRTPTITTDLIGRMQCPFDTTKMFSDPLFFFFFFCILHIVTICGSKFWQIKKVLTWVSSLKCGIVA